MKFMRLCKNTVLLNYPDLTNMYTPIDIHNASDAEIRLKLIEAQGELIRLQSNPLVRFYSGLIKQIDGISEKLNQSVLVDFDEVPESGSKTKSDRVMDLLVKAETLSRMIENIGSKHFPNTYLNEEVDSNRVIESYTKGNYKSKRLGN